MRYSSLVLRSSVSCTPFLATAASTDKFCRGPTGETGVQPPYAAALGLHNRLGPCQFRIDLRRRGRPILGRAASRKPPALGSIVGIF